MTDMKRSQIESLADYVNYDGFRGPLWVPGTFTLEDVRCQINGMRETGTIEEFSEDPLTDWTDITPEELFAFLNR